MAPFLQTTASPAKRRKQNKATPPSPSSAPSGTPRGSSLHPLALFLPFQRTVREGAGDLLILFLRFFRLSPHQTSAWDPASPAPCINTAGGPSQVPGAWESPSPGSTHAGLLGQGRAALQTQASGKGMGLTCSHAPSPHRGPTLHSQDKGDPGKLF